MPSLTFTKSPNFWTSEIDVNAQPVVTFSYDNDGLVTRANSMTITRDATSGSVTATTIPGGSVARTDEFTNRFGERDAYSMQLGGTILFSEQVGQRDALGRIIARTETVQGSAHSYHYDYDHAGRLTDVEVDGTSSGHYGYDANGNRVVATGSAGTVNGIYDKQDRIRAYGRIQYVWSLSGALLSKTDAVLGLTSYDYDAFGNLRGVALSDGHTIEYEIDARNRRIGKKLDGVRQYGLLYSDQLHPVAQLDANNEVLATFIYATRSNVPDFMVRNNQIYRFVVDHTGSVRMVVNHRRRLDSAEYSLRRLWSGAERHEPWFSAVRLCWWPVRRGYGARALRSARL